MPKSVSILSVFILIGLIAAQAQALETSWQVGTSNWSTGGNWDNGEPSRANFDKAYINNGGTAQITQAGEGCGYLYLGENAGQSGSAELSGTGHLDVYEEFIGYEGTATFTQTGGTHSIGQIIFAHSSGSDATYDMYNGSFDTIDFLIGYADGGSGTFNLSNGQVLAYYELIGVSGSGNFTQTGGTHTVDSVFGIRVGESTGSDGTYTISAGSLSVSSFYIGNNGTGTFTVTGDDPVIDLVSFIQNSNGTLNSQFDADGIATIDVSGTATLDGIWNVIDLGSAPLGIFNILTADGGITGTFDAVNLPDGTWSWGISSSSSETLWVQHVPEPATLALILAAGFLLLRTRRR